MTSPAEREIREAVEARLRALLPTARIIHEFTVLEGQNRADLAAVTRDSIVLVEIKSERDSLDRLEAQMRAFSKASHACIAALHERFFVDSWTVLHKGERYQINLGRRNKLWRYPEPDRSDYFNGWDLPRYLGNPPPQPRADTMLRLLWREELEHECTFHGLKIGRRAARTPMINLMAWRLTGREIAEAVCRQLRRRTFVEADPPIIDTASDFQPKPLSRSGT